MHLSRRHVDAGARPEHYFLAGVVLWVTDREAPRKDMVRGETTVLVGWVVCVAVGSANQSDMLRHPSGRRDVNAGPVSGTPVGVVRNEEARAYTRQGADGHESAKLYIFGPWLVNACDM